jgi:hypothetical protein
MKRRTRGGKNYEVGARSAKGILDQQQSAESIQDPGVASHALRAAQ